MSSELQGTGVALITPFKDDGALDFTGLTNLLKHVSDNGVDYLVVNGTTGESATTSPEEKQLILDHIRNKNAGKLPIVYGIGGNNTTDIIDRLSTFDLSGVSAILSVSPYYIKPSQEGIYQHYKKIAEASPVPVILYNVPGRTGSNISAETTIRLSMVDNIIGIKEASGDILQSLEITKKSKKGFLVISGDDMLTVPLISIGAKGVISVLANAFPLQFSTMVHHALNNRFAEATEILQKFCPINPCLYEEGNPVGIKEALALLNICQHSVRLPLVNGSEKLKGRIIDCLKDLQL